MCRPNRAPTAPRNAAVMPIQQTFPGRGSGARPTHRGDARGRGRGVAAKIAKAGMDDGLLNANEIIEAAARGELDIGGVSDVHRDAQLIVQGLWVCWEATTMDWVTFELRNVQRAIRRDVGVVKRMAPRSAPPPPSYIGARTFEPSTETRPTVPIESPALPESPSVPHIIKTDDVGLSSPSDVDEPGDQDLVWCPALTVEDHLRNLGVPLAQVNIAEPGSIDLDHLDELRSQLHQLQIPAAFFLEEENGAHMHGLVPRECVSTVVALYGSIAGEHHRGEGWVLHRDNGVQSGDDDRYAVVLTKDFEHSPQRPIELFTGYASKRGRTLAIDTVSTDWIQS